MTAAPAELTMEEVARAIAADIPDGSCVNLGIGLPLRIPAHVPAGVDIVFHSENGVLGVGPPPPAGEEDWDLVDAGKAAITLVPGAAIVSHVDSFALVRGGYVDVAVIGALQVTARGDLANWWDGTGIPGVGGAIDLAACAKSVFVMMRHNERGGAPKIVDTCTLPLTGLGVVARIYTELGVFAPADGILVLERLAPGVGIDEVRARTAVPLTDGRDGAADGGEVYAT